MKYVSEKCAGKPDSLLVIPEDGSFDNMVKLKGDKEVGDKINKIILKSVRRGLIKGIIGLSPTLAMLHIQCALTYYYFALSHQLLSWWCPLSGLFFLDWPSSISAVAKASRMSDT